MPWAKRVRAFRRRRAREEPALPRTPFVLLERHNLGPGSSALLAQLARHYTLIPISGRTRHSFRVGVRDAKSEAEAADRLTAFLGELDVGWEEHFAQPRPFSGH
jgi:hypothetical protein